MTSFEVGMESLEELKARHGIEMAELELQNATQLKSCKKKERAYYESYTQQQLFDLQNRHRDEVEELEEWIAAGNEPDSSRAVGVEREGDGDAAAAIKRKETEDAVAAAATIAAEAEASRIARARRKKEKVHAKLEEAEQVREPSVWEERWSAFYEILKCPASLHVLHA